MEQEDRLLLLEGHDSCAMPESGMRHNMNGLKTEAQVQKGVVGEVSADSKSERSHKQFECLSYEHERGNETCLHRQKEDAIYLSMLFKGTL